MKEEKVFNFLFDNQFKPTKQDYGYHTWIKEEGWEEYKIHIDIMNKSIFVEQADWDATFLKLLMELIDDDYRLLFPWYDDALENKLKQKLCANTNVQ